MTTKKVVSHEGVLDIQPGPQGIPEVRIIKDDGTVWLASAFIPRNLKGKKLRITVEVIE